MNSARQRITIIGTGSIGTSIGMTIRQSKDGERLEVVGHDREPARARQAQKLGAFDRVALNLDIALASAQLIILSVPMAALREVFSDIGNLIEPDAGVVVTDTAPLKMPAMAWAAESLPSGTHYVGGDPFLAPGTGGWEPLHGLLDASEHLFRDAVYAVTARAEDHPSAVRTVVNLAITLGATPLIMDPREHDAVRLMAGALPNLIATALFQVTSEAPGWSEVRKAAGREFATATAAASGDVDSRRMTALLGRETLLRGLDAMQVRLTKLREAVAAGDGGALEAELAEAADRRERWMRESQARSWQLERQDVGRESLLERTLHGLLGEGMTGRSKE